MQITTFQLSGNVFSPDEEFSQDPEIRAIREMSETLARDSHYSSESSESEDSGNEYMPNLTRTAKANRRHLFQLQRVSFLHIDKKMFQF